MPLKLLHLLYDLFIDVLHLDSTFMMVNSSISADGASFPSYSLTPVPPLLPIISDGHLLLVLPIVAYWVYALLFYFIDEYDILPQYRLHTPKEFLARNYVPMRDVVIYVLKYQALTTVLGLWLGGEVDMTGMEDFEMARWAHRLKSLSISVSTSVGVSRSRP